MASPITVIDIEDISELEKLLLVEGKIQVLPHLTLSMFSQNQLTLFCHKHAVYGVPTTELIEWLKIQIGGRLAIEIGGGNGVFGRALDIPSTDSYAQDTPDIKNLYALIGQPTTKYGENVEKLTAVQAGVKYRPKVIIASWVTERYDRGGEWYGVHETILWESSYVETYIHIGNALTHASKSLLKIPHEEYKFDWLYSRSPHKTENVIYVWNKGGLNVQN